jgi:hypothetical protein
LPNWAADCLVMAYFPTGSTTMQHKEDIYIIFSQESSFRRHCTRDIQYMLQTKGENRKDRANRIG